jgi:hypothetical protein
VGAAGGLANNGLAKYKKRPQTDLGSALGCAVHCQQQRRRVLVVHGVKGLRALSVRRAGHDGVEDIADDVGRIALGGEVQQRPLAPILERQHHLALLLGRRPG